MNGRTRIELFSSLGVLVVSLANQLDYEPEPCLKMVGETHSSGSLGAAPLTPREWEPGGLNTEGVLAPPNYGPAGVCHVHVDAKPREFVLAVS